jgi:hypothetical protein
MKKVKDLINPKTPLITLIINKRADTPPGEEDQRIFDVNDNAQDFIIALNDHFKIFSYENYDVEEFLIGIGQNPSISGEVYLDRYISENHLKNLLYALNMTIHEFASESEHEMNYYGLGPDSKKDSEIFCEYYDPSFSLNITLVHKNSGSSTRFVCSTEPINKKKHDKEVHEKLDRLEASGTRLSEPY